MDVVFWLVIGDVARVVVMIIVVLSVLVTLFVLFVGDDMCSTVCP